MRHALQAIAALVLLAGAAHAQNTIPVSPTSQLSWTASPGHNSTFGTPPVPLLSTYRIDMWTKANVSSGTPSGAPAITVDAGKGTPDASNTLFSALLRSLIPAGTEYYAFVTAVGPGGESRSTAGIGPFGYPSPPAPATAVRVTP